MNLDQALYLLGALSDTVRSLQEALAQRDRELAELRRAAAEGPDLPHTE